MRGIQVKYWLGVTDNRWFDFVSARGLVEVNFWQPSARAPFTSLPEGTWFFFKLKRPNNHIVGGGRFVSYTHLSVSMAWDIFGEQNGAATLSEFAALIADNAHGHLDLTRDIGCTVLTDVFYLPPDSWIPAADHFPRSIVRGKSYDIDADEGAALWDELNVAMQAHDLGEYVREEGARYGAEFLQRGRLGQGAFRSLVLDAYGRRCALTGESTVPVLEAAHIRPYADAGSHHPSNGLLLRSDFHKLFDVGLVTVEPDYRIRVSPRIRDQWFNGKAYYRLDGRELATLPVQSRNLPDREALLWHNENRFLV